MKTALVALIGITMLPAAHLHAQYSTPVPAATSSPAAAAAAAEQREETTGTIMDLTPGRSMVLHTGTNAGEPVVFRFAPEVTYVDSDGRKVEAAGLRKNLRVRVSFVKQAGENVVDTVTILQ